ncbi:fibronectin type III domain-containing protein [Paenibacillus piri]|uniref:Fibronectin type-III domain-containing protein n=1 Tax=Paenibacillus piri TaxID=2547395 RepID=A0A4R5KL29_9BACL|nr:fibronectin type III domain-containing protein [Paenibacillus piri]TDF96269.1 hypothetical protein E1757_17945 [Paenibacillus piri]
MAPIDSHDQFIVSPSTSDESGTINSGIASGYKTIVFTRGTHTINSNVTIPRDVLAVIETGAKLKIGSGATLTINGELSAPKLPVFIGDGKVATGVKGRVLYPQWFGASGLTGTGGRGIVGRGTSSAGSSTITVTDGIDRFSDGNTVIVIGGGRNPSLGTPAVPSLKLGTYDPQTGKVTTGNTKYTYQIVAITKDGAYSLPCTPVALSNGPDASYFEYYQGTRVEMTMPSAPSGADGWAIYGASSNPAGHQGLLGVQWTRSAQWFDYGPGRWDNSVPPWVPTAVPAQTGSRFLATTIVSGGGTSVLTLKDALASAVQQAPIMADDSVALQKCYDLLDQAGGGTIELIKGRYYIHIPTNTDPKTAVNYKSNVTLISYEQAIIQGYTNFTMDTMILFAAKNGRADNFAFDGIVFDGGNETTTTEYSYWGIATADGDGGTGTGLHNDFRIRNCEFRYFTGKALWLGGGNPQNYTVADNYFHHGNSNVMTVSGTNFAVHNNRIDTSLMYGGKSYIRAAESIIMMNADSGLIEGNFIRNWGNISSGAYTIKNIQIVNNTMNDTNGIGLAGYKENIMISGNTLNISTTDYIVGHGIAIESTRNNSPCLKMTITDNIFNTSGKVQTLTFSVDGGNIANEINVSNNFINHRDSSYIPLNFRFMTDVQFNHNEIICTNVTGGGATDLAIDLTYDMSSADSNWTVIGNNIPGKNLSAPSGAVVVGNRVGGMRLDSNHIVVGNRVTGTSGPNTWGGLVNVGGSNNVISNNTIDLSGTVNIDAAIKENSRSTNNIITGNRILNYGSKALSSLILHNQNSTVMQNMPSDRKQIVSDKQPTAGSWVVGDTVYNNTPSVSNPYVGWICTIGGTAIDPNKAWQPNRSYNVNDQVYANGKIYTSTAAGQSSTTAPSHINGTASGGSTLVWQYVGFKAVFNPFGLIVFASTTPPAVPTGLTAVAGNQQATFKWNPNTDPDLAGYNLYPKQNNTKVNSTLIQTTSYTLTGIPNGKTTTYELVAVNTAGIESGRSAGAAVTPSGS